MEDSRRDYSERLERLKSYLSVSYLQLANNIGINVQNFYNIKKEQNRISPKIAKLICDAYPQISFNWLMFGEGEMIKGSAPTATASNNSTAVAGHNNTVNTSQQYVSNLLSIIQKRDEQIDRLLTIIEDITAK